MRYQCSFLQREFVFHARIVLHSTVLAWQKHAPQSIPYLTSKSSTKSVISSAFLQIFPARHPCDKGSSRGESFPTYKALFNLRHKMCFLYRHSQPAVQPPVANEVNDTFFWHYAETTRIIPFSSSSYKAILCRGSRFSRLLVSFLQR